VNRGRSVVFIGDVLIVLSNFVGLAFPKKIQKILGEKCNTDDSQTPCATNLLPELISAIYWQQ
jgi:hypothetical protein